MRHQLTLPLILGLTCAFTHADIAPTRFIGSGIRPMGDTDIRMDSANVSIVYGKPCSMTATFTMVNESSRPRTVAIGFPMPIQRPPWPQHDPPDPLSMVFDGREAEVHGPFPEEKTSGRSRWAWYHCTNEFAPGITRVDVSTVLRTSGLYDAPYTQTLDYCLRTGGQWAGRIGEERVTIRFPYPLVTEQLRSVRPEGARIEGDTILWEFSDIEPEQDEFDIRVAFIRPDFMRALIELREEYEHHPESGAVAVRLAKQLLALGPQRSNYSRLPYRLTTEEYERIYSRIETPRDLEIFTRFYRSNFNGGYRSISRTLVGEETAVPQILADAGYRDKDARSGVVREGEELLLKVLKSEPHNAAAWNVYLANYWRFSLRAVGHPFPYASGRPLLSKGQAQAIQLAAKHCPDDGTIQLWSDVCQDGLNKAAMKQLVASINDGGYRKAELRSSMSIAAEAPTTQVR